MGSWEDKSLTALSTHPFAATMSHGHQEKAARATLSFKKYSSGLSSLCDVCSFQGYSYDKIHLKKK